MAEKNLGVGPGPDGRHIPTSRDSDSKPFQTEIEDLVNVEFTDEQNRRVLRKIDMVYALFTTTLWRPLLT